MATMERHYLIDYENVHEDGLCGGEKLSKNDYVHLFFTKNASKISIEKIAYFSQSNLSLHEIPVGSQSLDMHLVSYLGYLIGAENNKEYKYIIVSKDTDYDNIIRFWKEYKNTSIIRQTQIKVSNAEKKPDKTKEIAGGSKNINNKQELNNEIQKKLAKANFSGDIVGYVSSLVCKNYDKENAKQKIYRAIISEYGQKKGLDIYNHIKKNL